LTLIFTGIRRGELCGLRWESIDLDNRLSIDLNVTSVIRVGIVEKEPKTHRSKRKVELPLTLCKHLKKYKKWYYETKEQMGDRWDNKDWLFVNTDTGKRIVPNTINSWINKVTMQAGLGRWTVHSYRHTNITTKLLNNVPLLEVAGEAGHSRTSTTTDQYGHFLATQKRVGPAVLDQLIGGG
jgi:integrase